MLMRSLFATAALALSALPAAAGDYGCAGDCYRRAWLPPVYGAVAEQTPVRAPRTYALVTPPEYRRIEETVMIRPARRIWTVRRDAWGRRIGCWVEIPARYAVRPRTVMVREASLTPYSQGTAYGLSLHDVVVEPAHRGWVPLERGGPED